MTYEENQPNEHRRRRPRTAKKQISLKKAMCLILPVGLLVMSLMLMSCNKEKPETPGTESTELQAEVNELTEKNIKLSNRVVELMTQNLKHTQNQEIYETVIKAQTALITGDSATLNECISYLQANEENLPAAAREALAIILEYKDAQ